MDLIYRKPFLRFVKFYSDDSELKIKLFLPKNKIRHNRTVQGSKNQLKISRNSFLKNDPDQQDLVSLTAEVCFFVQLT